MASDKNPIWICSSIGVPGDVLSWVGCICLPVRGIDMLKNLIGLGLILVMVGALYLLFLVDWRICLGVWLYIGAIGSFESLKEW